MDHTGRHVSAVLQAAVADMRKACTYDATLMMLLKSRVFKDAQQLYGSELSENMNREVASAWAQELKLWTPKTRFSKNVRLRNCGQP